MTWKGGTLPLIKGGRGIAPHDPTMGASPQDLGVKPHYLVSEVVLVRFWIIFLFSIQKFEEKKSTICFCGYFSVDLFLIFCNIFWSIFFSHTFQKIPRKKKSVKCKKKWTGKLKFQNPFLGFQTVSEIGKYFEYKVCAWKWPQEGAKKFRKDLSENIKSIFMLPWVCVYLFIVFFSVFVLYLFRNVNI